MKIILGMGSKKNLKIFCNYFDNIKYLSEYITLNLSPESVYIQGMSMDHCCIYELTLKAEWFEFYNVLEQDVKTISFKTSTFSKILDTRQKNQFLILENSVNNSSYLNIILKNKPNDLKEDEYPKEFEITLLSIEQDILTIPETEYSVEFVISSKMLKNINDELMQFGETLQIYCDEENIKMITKGDEGSMTLNLFNNDIDYISEYMIEEELKLDIEFNNKHFATFCKFMKLSDNINLSFNKDFPLKMEYIFDNENIKCNFMLAPKIKED